MTDRTSPADVVVFDLASLRFKFAASRRSLAVLTSSGEILAVVTARPDEDPNEVVFRALSSTADQTRVLRTDDAGQVRGYGVALYNPFTAQIAYTAATGQVTFACETPAPIGCNGTVGQVHGPAGERRLDARDLQACEFVADMAATTRTLAAYR